MSDDELLELLRREGVLDDVRVLAERLRQDRALYGFAAINVTTGERIDPEELIRGAR